jgi:hypothetical protein
LVYSPFQRFFWSIRLDHGEEKARSVPSGEPLPVAGADNYLRTTMPASAARFIADAMRAGMLLPKAVA